MHDLNFGDFESDVTPDEVFRAIKNEIADIVTKLGSDESFFQEVDVSVFGFDLNGRVTVANTVPSRKQGSNDFGWVETLLDKLNYRPDVSRMVEQGQEFELRDIKTDDGEIYNVSSVMLFDANGSPLVIGTTIQNSKYIDTVLDLCTHTEARYRKELEKQRRSALILKTVLEANSSLILEDVLTSASRSISEAVGLPFCGMYLLDKDSGVFRITGRTGHLKDSALLKAITDNPLSVDDPLIKAATGSGGPIVIHDGPNRDLLSDLHKEVLRIKTLVVIPLRARDKMLGFAMLPTFDRYVDVDIERLEIADGIAKAVALAIDNAQLFQKSQKLAVMEERNRLAQEIHDGLAQRLTGVVMQLEAAELLLQSQPAEAQKRLARAKELARESLEEARRSVWNLRPKPLEEHSLSTAIRKEVDLLASDINIKASFKASGKVSMIPSKVENYLLRMAQETLGNIRRHSQAQAVAVKLAFSKDKISLTIADDGIGFDPALELDDADSHGLSGLKERARDLGGICWIESRAGQGAEVQISIPISEWLTNPEDI